MSTTIVCHCKLKLQKDAEARNTGQTGWLSSDDLLVPMSPSLNRLMMMHTVCLNVNVSSISVCHKNIGSSSGHIYSPNPPALLAHLPCWPTCLVDPPALLAHLPCWSIYLLGMPALFEATTSALVLLKYIFWKLLDFYSQTHLQAT